MGTEGWLCLFDYERYLAELVPAFQRGEHDPFVRKIINWKNERTRFGMLPTYENLAQVVAFCDETMTTCDLGSFRVHDGIIYRSHLDYPPTERPSTYDEQKKQYGKPRRWWDDGNLTELFNLALTSHFVTHYTFWNRVQWVNGSIFPPYCAWDPVLLELADLLDTRSRYWCYDSLGVCGWLDIEETQLLSYCLPTFCDANADTGIRNDVSAAILWNEPGEIGLEAIHLLRQFSLMVEMAAEARVGLLWGHNLDVLGCFLTHPHPESFPHKPKRVFRQFLKNKSGVS